VTISRLIDAKLVGKVADTSGTELWAGSLEYGFDGVFGWFNGRFAHGFLLLEIKKPCLTRHYAELSMALEIDI